MENVIECYAPVFSGFYCTIWGAYMDGQIEDIFAQNPDLSEDACARIQYSVDYAGWRVGVCQSVVEYLSEKIKEKFPEVLAVEYDGIKSPREYNFENDRICLKMTVTDYTRFVEHLISMCDDKECRGYVRENFSSCSGFISWVGGDFDHWCDDLRNDTGHAPAMITELFTWLLSKDAKSLEGFEDEMFFYLYEQTNMPREWEYMSDVEYGVDSDILVAVMDIDIPHDKITALDRLLQRSPVACDRGSYFDTQVKGYLDVLVCTVYQNNQFIVTDRDTIFSAFKQCFDLVVPGVTVYPDLRLMWQDSAGHIIPTAGAEFTITAYPKQGFPQELTIARNEVFGLTEHEILQRFENQGVKNIEWWEITERIEFE